MKDTSDPDIELEEDDVTEGEIGTPLPNRDVMSIIDPLVGVKGIPHDPGGPPLIPYQEPEPELTTDQGIDEKNPA
ncbi:MAG TPA: hypothetical protein VJP45_12850 [Candidatus Limnocylindria bacterium]|nr:hypothetical protein [Candidatus Limnocylindria bacterium]